MNHDQLIKRADEILKARTGFSVPEEEIKELLTSWRPCSENPEDFEAEARDVADHFTSTIFENLVDEIMMARIGYTLSDLPNPNDEIIEYAVGSDIDWDNLDQYGPQDFREAAENVAELWIAGCWDEETGSFK
ncbi:MAG: hypothetical protein EBS30_13725 [Planctomycetes bacterium]|nr:hypothetical protein [Planctomycetota bacterium]